MVSMGQVDLMQWSLRQRRGRISTGLVLVLGASTLLLASPMLVMSAGAVRRDAGRELLHQVPPSLRGSCSTGGGSAAKGMRASLTCAPKKAAVSSVVFLGFKTTALAAAYYAQQRRSHQIDQDTETDCAAYDDSESPYRTTDGVSGRVFCSTRKKAQLIAWLDNTTVAAARGTDDVAVYKWWARLVDRTMNATQLALLNQVPPGIDRANCGDDGSDAIKCADPAKDVYVVRYTKYQSPSALAAGYSSAEAPSRVAMDSPPQGDPSSDQCSFETTWSSENAPDVTAGRIFCYQDQDADYQVAWTIDGTTTLARATGKLHAALQFFKNYATSAQGVTT